MATRSLICTTLGHVDHGKSSILDRIRGTAIVKSEAGQITQAIGASIIPLEVIRKICGQLLSSSKIKLTIPGLLLIDTRGMLLSQISAGGREPRGHSNTSH